MRRDREIPNQELCRSLKKLLAKYGYLSEAMLRTKRGKFSVATYQRRLGTMQDIYDLLNVDNSAGLLAPRLFVPAIVNVRNSIILQILKRFPNELRALRPVGAQRRSNLLLDGKLSVFVWIAIYYRTKTGKIGWKLNPPKTENDAPVLLCMMKPGNQDFKLLYLFTKLDLPRTEYTFGREGRLLMSGHKLAGISELCSRVRQLTASTKSHDVSGSCPASSLLP